MESSFIDGTPAVQDVYCPALRGTSQQRFWF
jgi:hypothetical protein